MGQEMGLVALGTGAVLAQKILGPTADWIGQTSHDRKLSSGNLRVRWPGDLLVVSLATD